MARDKKTLSHNIEFTPSALTLTKSGDTFTGKTTVKLTNALLMRGTLTQHLLEINEQALDMMESLTKQMAKTEGVTEQLKRTNQMEWVGRMNNIRNRADEIVKA